MGNLLDNLHARQQAFAESQRRYEACEPADREWPEGTAEIELDVTLTVELDRDGRWRFSKEADGDLPAGAQVWLAKNYDKRIRAAVAADLDRQAREYGERDL